MNLPKITKYGGLLTKFHQYLPFFRSVNNNTKGTSLLNTTFFSQFCNPFRFTDSNKLTPTAFGALKLISRGYKIRGHLELRCKDCYMVRKDGEMYVLCSSHPRHKQKKMTKRTKYSWILTYAFQSKQRPY